MHTYGRYKGETKECIASAAIMEQEVLAIGKNHGVIIHSLFALTGKVVKGQQGFVTSTGRFVDREEGLKIAIESGQIVKKNGNDSILFSEDMLDNLH